MAANKYASYTFCKCGEPWEHPCRCPERVLERFSDTLTNQVFYFEDFTAWLVTEFGEADQELINAVLNLDGVVELGSDMYQTPYEIQKSDMGREPDEYPESTSKPEEGSYWYVQLAPHCALVVREVVHVTDKTILLADPYALTNIDPMRFKLSDVELVEPVPEDRR